MGVVVAGTGTSPAEPAATSVGDVRRTELASIAAISYHLGSLRPISELDFLRDDPRKLELYQLAGFDRYAESDLSMRELAYRSAVQTMRDCGVLPSDIDICLYVAESQGRDEQVSSSEVNGLLSDLGLNTAVPIHISILNCANITAALRVAAALIRAGEARHVLVVSVDKASRKYAGRMMFQEMSIKSDISVSCIVSSPGTGTYGLLYLGQVSSPGLFALAAKDPASYSMPKFNSVRRAARQATDALGLHPADFAGIITNNYSREVTKMLIQLSGFPRNGGAALANIGRFGHAVAGDVLINLKDLENEGRIKAGDRFFLMSDSITSSSVACVQKR